MGVSIHHTQLLAFGTINIDADEERKNKMKTDEVKRTVKTRYGKFAEAGGKKEDC